MQRCTEHKRANLLEHCPAHARRELRRDYNRIVYAKNGIDARKAYDELVAKWTPLAPAVVRSLEEAGNQLLTFYEFPRAMWKSIRTTNALENLNREFRRRTKTQASFSSEESAVALLFERMVWRRGLLGIAYRRASAASAGLCESRERLQDSSFRLRSHFRTRRGTQMDGPASLRQALVNLSDTFITSFTESLMTYALGRRVEYYDMLAVRAIALEAAHNGNRMSSFIFGIVNSAAFQMKKSENTEPITVVGESGPP